MYRLCVSRIARLLLGGASLMVQGGCTEQPTPPLDPPPSLPASPGGADPATTGGNTRTAQPKLAESPDRAGRCQIDFVSRSGIEGRDVVFHNGREAGLNTILEIVGGGVGCLDYDLDGDPDVVLPLGGTIDAKRKRVRGAGIALARNCDQWRFPTVTASARLTQPPQYLHGVASCDWNEDGICDLIAYGWQGAVFYQNLGDGTWLDCTEWALPKLRLPWLTSAAYGDFDADGDLDFYFGSYVDWDFTNHRTCPDSAGRPDVCSPTAFHGSPNTLVLNLGDGTFGAAENLLPETEPGKTLGAVAFRMGPTRRPALYVANDLEPNFLFIPESDGYREMGMLLGAAVDDSGTANGSMGIAVFDFNNDRHSDLFVCNFEHEMMGLYLNRQDRFFEHFSRPAGLNFSENRAVGFGVVARDWDADGDEDLLVACGHVHYRPDRGTMSQLPMLLENVDGQTLRRVTIDDPFFQQPRVGRGLATADLDSDGDSDIVATQLDGPPSLVENRCPAGRHHWLRIRLIGTRTARQPIGTRVLLDWPGGTMMRQLVGGGSYLSDSEPVLEFAWPRSSEQQPPTVRLRIEWTDGTVTEVAQANPDQTLTLVQP